jgi:hypothetical protein
MRSGPGPEPASAPRRLGLGHAPRSRPGGDPNWLTSDQVGQAAVGVARTPAIADEHVILDTTDDLKRELARMNV